jgi:putative endonuclease
MDRAAVGAWGEGVAESWYVSAGYTVVGRNWHCPLGEIDLVVRAPAGELVFVEVKTRSGDRFGLPWEAVTPLKQRRIRRAAGHWLSVHDTAAHRGAGRRRDLGGVVGTSRNSDVRFDVVGITRIGDGDPIVDVFEQAF